MLAGFAVTPATASAPDFGSVTAVIAHFTLDSELSESDVTSQARAVPVAGNDLIYEAGIDEIPAITIGIDDQLQAAGSDAGWSQFTDPTRTQGAFARGAEWGGDVLFADSGPVQSFEVDLGVPIVGIHTTLDGVIVDFEGDGGLAITDQWAVDHTGTSLPTSFSSRDSVLIQEVTSSDDTASIAASFAWTYLFEFGIPFQTAFEVRGLLMAPGGFGSLFPIPGRPSNFPGVNQLLPLTMPPNLNFTCYMNGSAYESWPGGQGHPGGSQFNFSFRAAAGHIEGAGSNISFTFVTQNLETNFFVFGQVMNANPGGYPRPFVEAAAYTQWHQFATNINNVPGT